MAILPYERVSFKEKQRPEFYEALTDYIINTAISLKQKTTIQKCLDAANGIMSKEDILLYAKNLTATDKNFKKALEAVDFKAVDFIVPIKEKMISEYIKLYNSFHVYLRDNSAIFRRNEKLNKIMADMITSKIVDGIQSGQINQDDFSFEEFKKNFIDNWVDEKVSVEQDALDLLRNLTDDEVKYIHNFFYWWATEEYYTYRTIQNGEVIVETKTP